MSHNQYQREMAMALETQPPIFKLDVDCFEELFDWLSLEDLHTFGRTCRRMQQVAGHFFRLKYPGASVHCLENGIYCNGVKINGFANYIENMYFDSDCLAHYRFAKLNAFKSLTRICFNDTTFDDKKVAYIKKFVANVEIVGFHYCIIEIDSYNKLLQYCKNIKRIRVENSGICGEMKFNWLLQHCPSLEQLVLSPWCHGNENGQIDELMTFFKHVPSVQHFATRPLILRANRRSFLAFNIKLDCLAIRIDKPEDEEFLTLLNEFHERAVYKRLHLYVSSRRHSLENLHQFVPASAVEKLAYDWLPMNVTLLPFVTLKELYSYHIPDDLDVNAIASALVNIERIHFELAHPNHVFAFIRLSRKLSHIAFGIMGRMEKNALDLTFWSKERGKLAGARKVVVYVDEIFFLGTKNATQNKAYSLIEVKRLDSYCFTSDFPGSYHSY